jgi:hypothetical protein
VKLSFLFALALVVLSLGSSVAAGQGTPRLPNIPGVRYHAVRQATIDSTICVKGWTATIRPPVAYTGALKKWLLTDQRLPGTVSDYQLDHLLSLELGGAPYATGNLWMQDAAQGHVDDGMENRLHRDVCAGKLTLVQAQRAELAWKRIQG